MKRSRISDDFRVSDEAYEEKLHREAEASGEPWRRWDRLHSLGAEFPSDRKGLMAAVHPVLDPADEARLKAVWEGGSVAKTEYAVQKMAERLARRLLRRVYVVMTKARWHLVLLALDDGSYDDGGAREDDQYIAYYEPDGSYNFVGCS